MMDLSSPAARREALRMVDVADPGAHHAMLREIFELERSWREGPDDGVESHWDSHEIEAWARRMRDYF